MLIRWKPGYGPFDPKLEKVSDPSTLPQYKLPDDMNITVEVVFVLILIVVIQYVIHPIDVALTYMRDFFRNLTSGDNK
jgi:hypothetical protein